MAEEFDGKLVAQKVQEFRGVLKDFFTKNSSEVYKPDHDFPKSDLIRFLIAREFDVSKSLPMYIEFLNWFQQIKPDQILPAQIASELRFEKTFIRKFDKKNRPILYCIAGKHDPSKTTPDQTVLLMVYIFYQAIKLMDGEHYDFLLVVDFGNFGWSNIDIPTAKKCVHVLETYFPERLAHIFAVNTSFIFWAFWKLVSPFVPARTKSKIKFLRGPDEYVPVLLETIDKENLLKAYGGDDDFVYKYVDAPNERKDN